MGCQEGEVLVLMLDRLAHAVEFRFLPLDGRGQVLGLVFLGDPPEADAPEGEGQGHHGGHEHPVAPFPGGAVPALGLPAQVIGQRDELRRGLGLEIIPRLQPHEGPEFLPEG